MVSDQVTLLSFVDARRAPSKMYKKWVCPCVGLLKNSKCWGGPEACVKKKPYIRGIRLSGTGIRYTLFEAVPDRYHRSGRLQKMRVPRHQALTILVKALSGYRLCGQEPSHRLNILVYLRPVFRF